MHEHTPHPMHHEQGWQPVGPRRRWLEPFLLLAIARGTTHGYALIARLNGAGYSPMAIDVGSLYRSLRELEVAGLVASTWAEPPGTARRREYALTRDGRERLTQWAEVMEERARLVGTFLSDYGDLATGEAPRTMSTKEAVT
jgi:poly-beta-hydroxybutyrate-responsive repressor